MNETANLKKLKTSCRQAIKSLKNQQLFSTYNALFTDNTVFLLNELCAEALQTPAGERWFRGQLKIHTIVAYFYQELVQKGNRSLLKAKDVMEFKDLSEKFLDELTQLIKSGTGRYITG